MYSRNFTVSASDLYDFIDFNTDSPYNLPPPEPFLTFLIGAVLSLVGFIMWVRRVQAISRHLRSDVAFGSCQRFTTIKLRTWLTAYIENDCALFTCIRKAAKAFVFLAGLQINYQWAFLGILVFFTIESCLDPLRVLLCYCEATHIDDLVVTSKFLRAQLKKNQDVTTLQPTNVYEDMTRGGFVVGMIFVTQVILIGFVVRFADRWEDGYPRV